MSYSQIPGWFVRHEALPPAENMAWDEALSLAVRRGRLGGFLRFYRWNPPTLSFGYFQKPSRILRPEALTCREIGLVRRASGGKMVFHDQEWTFSCALPTSVLKQRQTSTDVDGFLTWFRLLVEPLAITLRQLGVAIEFAEVQKGGRSGARAVDEGTAPRPAPAGDERQLLKSSATAPRDRVHCFSAAAGHSLMVGERKLIGAAGIVREGVLLVHGSIPIAPGRELPPLFTSGIDPQAHRETIYLKEVLAANMIERLPERVAATMQEYLGIILNEMSTTPAVVADVNPLVKRLAEEKFADLDWPAQPVERWDELASSLLTQK
ncbi:MAG TPA: hypothetical protein PKO06_11155 [Candidatus Ozemobacteraceae bacterium]|nr:hypothetical protein [Candidatus Ozemobacteraceae bacterium]